MKAPVLTCLAAGICMSLAAGSAHAQVQLSDAFDGNWWNPDDAGRGVLVDYLPDQADPGRGVLWLALYTYDAQGNPTWVNVQTDTIGNVASGDIHASIYRAEGGSFDDAHLPGNVSTDVVGQAIINVDSCDAITVELAPDAAAGLGGATRYELQPYMGRHVACSVVATDCPAGTTDLGNNQCGLPNEITGSLRLPKGKDYIVHGQVSVREGGVLTVDPGVTVIGSDDPGSINFIAVLAGGQIIADGTREEPITFTGPEPVPGSWAGLVLAGRSLCNDEQEEELACEFEAISDVKYGGQRYDDNSGILRYVRILWAGQEIRPDEELNSLTLCGVGSGTTLEYVQVHGGLDDGFEMFGGSVNGRYLVATQVGDDMFDFDDGYFGKLQFLLGWQGSENHDQTQDSHGIESDNSNPAPYLEPRTRPVVSNITLIGSANGSEGARIRRGSGGIYHNAVIHGFANYCLNVNGDDSAALGPDYLAFNHSFIGQCGLGPFTGSAEAFWNAGTGNRQGDPQFDGWMPRAGSPLLGAGATPPALANAVAADGSNDDSFFLRVDYIGAFDGVNDWTAGWLYNAGAQ